jgi:hypothetical protein
MSELNVKVQMMTAVTEALKYKKANPKLDNEKIMQHISNVVKSIKNQDTKIAMVATVSKALSITEREPKLKDKEIMKRVISELPEILDKIE